MSNYDPYASLFVGIFIWYGKAEETATRQISVTVHAIKNSLIT